VSSCLSRVRSTSETREKSPTTLVFIDDGPTTMDMIWETSVREPAAVSGETMTRPRGKQSTRLLHVQTHTFLNGRRPPYYYNIHLHVCARYMYIVKHSVTRDVRLAYVVPWRPPNVPLPVRSVAASDDDDDRATIPETTAHMTSTSYTF